jgi:hypothetical protein
MAADAIHRGGGRSRLTLSAEMRALCLLAGTSNQDQDAIALAMANPRLDWTRILALAEWHGTAALLTNILPGIEGAIPAQFRERVSEVCCSTAKKSLIMSAELLWLCAQFRAAPVKAVCYKGPALGATLYGDAAMRPCGDLDFILSIRDLERARAMLMEFGYVPLLPLDESQQKRQARAQGALVFVNPKSSILVDLHFSIVPQHLAMDLPPEPMLERAEEYDFCGAKTLSLRPEDLLLVLCVHGSKHLWERLLWICDIAQTLKTYPRMDWELVLERANSAGIRRVLLLGLSLAEQLLGAGLPDSIARLCRQDAAILKLVASVARRLEMGADEPADAGRWLFMLRSRERYRDRLAAMGWYAAAPRLETWSGPKRIPALLPFYMIGGAARAAARSMRPLRRNKTGTV